MTAAPFKAVPPTLVKQADSIQLVFNAHCRDSKNPPAVKKAWADGIKGHTAEAIALAFSRLKPLYQAILKG